MKALQDLTDRQRQVLDYIVDFWRANDNIPNTREIRDFLEAASQTAALSHLNALIRKGYLERKETEKSRSRFKFTPEFKATLPEYQIRVAFDLALGRSEVVWVKYRFNEDDQIEIVETNITPEQKAV